MSHGTRTALALALALVAVPGCAAGGPSAEAPPAAATVDPADPRAPTGGVNAPERRDAPYVVMVSLDGFAASYVERYRPPHLLRLARRGLWAREGMIPAYPSKTFPNHYTLVTGLHPSNHGLVANTFWDPERGETYRISDREAVEDGSWYGGEPLWVTAERQGMVAGSFFWVGSEADVGGVRPSHWRPYDGSVPGEDRVDQVLEWLAWPAERRPHLITLYFSDTDDAGHGHGPGSREVEAAVDRVDRLVGRLVDGIRALDHGERVHIIVVSDHGMDAFTPEATRYLEDVISLDGVRVAEAGPNGNLWVEGGPDAARRVRDRIREGLPGVKAYLPDETPEHLHYRGHPRLGDVVLIPDSGVVVYPSRRPGPARGGFTHGWDPTLSTMAALFIAAGPRLARGEEIPPFANIHVAPLVASLLELEPPAGIDGDPAVLGRWMRSPAPR